MGGYYCTEGEKYNWVHFSPLSQHVGIVYVSVWALVIGFLSLSLLLFLGKLELWLLSSLGRLLLMKRPNTAAVPIPFIQYSHTWARW